VVKGLGFLAVGACLVVMDKYLLVGPRIRWHHSRPRSAKFADFPIALSDRRYFGNSRLEPLTTYYFSYSL